MADNGLKQSKPLMNYLDGETRGKLREFEKILQLTRTKVEAQLEYFNDDSNANEELKKALLLVQEEINSSFKAMDSIANMPVRLANKEVIEQLTTELNTLLTKNLERISDPLDD